MSKFKLTILLLSLALLVGSLAATPIAAASAAITVKAEVTPSSGEVVVTGTISSGAGTAVTVQVINPSGGIDFMNQSISGDGGHYRFSYSLNRNSEGVYHVRAGGTGVETPATTQFTYRIGQSSGNSGGGGGGGGVIVTPPSGKGTTELRDDGTIEGKPYYDPATGQAMLGLDSALLQSAVKLAKSNVSGVKVIPMAVQGGEGDSSYVLEWPVSALSEVGKGIVYRLSTAIGVFDLPGHMLQGVVSGAETIELVIAAADLDRIDRSLQDAIGDKPIIQIYFRLNGARLPWSNTQAPVTISLPYQPNSEENGNEEHLVVWHINEDGNVRPVPNGGYDEASGNVVFRTAHFSYYAVAYVTKTFADITHLPWAKKSIEVLASKGVITGTSSTAFSPSRSITRADYMLLLVRTLELNADTSSVKGFSDVAPGSYYEEGMAVAKALGIAQGFSDNSFRPNETISRQDMMVLTARALQQYGRLQAADSAARLDSFQDRDLIAKYAVPYVASLVNDGLIEGSDKGRLNPEGSASRAEAAVFLYRIYMK
ncbi:S-layer family protein [Cohnella sp. SGD-V74]|uniref:S-layer homology domain-containing protein n=1 Tax=unclassified Cohnella TaxID=2636738 RepID=UPI000D446BB1|nr:MULTISPECIES: S-layer homology domain-containing protein [unclassified Cohnella]PRX71620.1 S-layer family protein [Cohnella sp. SGD-V74]